MLAKLPLTESYNGNRSFNHDRVQTTSGYAPSLGHPSRTAKRDVFPPHERHPGSDPVGSFDSLDSQCSLGPIGSLDPLDPSGSLGSLPPLHFLAPQIS